MFIRWSIIGLFVNSKRNNEKTDNFMLYSSKDIREIEDNISGYDLRPFIGKETDQDILPKVDKYFRQMRLVRYLENNNISIHDKLSSITNYTLLENGSKYAYNITEGGLYKDWDFVF